jgi:putative heme iron utilization protein
VRESGNGEALHLSPVFYLCAVAHAGFKTIVLATARAAQLRNAPTADSFFSLADYENHQQR